MRAMTSGISLVGFEERASEAAQMLKALSNEKRLMILCKLLEHGEMSVNSLIVDVGLSQSAMSQHLARMRDEKIVDTRRDAQQIFYRLAKLINAAEGKQFMSCGLIAVDSPEANKTCRIYHFPAHRTSWCRTSLLPISMVRQLCCFKASRSRSRVNALAPADCTDLEASSLDGDIQACKAAAFAAKPG